MNREYKFKVGTRVKVLDPDFLQDEWMYGTVQDTTTDAVYILFDEHTEATRIEQSEFDSIKLVR